MAIFNSYATNYQMLAAVSSWIWDDWQLIWLKSTSSWTWNGKGNFRRVTLIFIIHDVVVTWLQFIQIIYPWYCHFNGHCWFFPPYYITFLIIIGYIMLYICIPWYVSEKMKINPQIVTILPHRWWETIGFRDLPYFQIRGQVDGNSWLQSRCFLVAYWNTGTPIYHRLGDISYISHKITTVAAKTTTGWWFQPFWKILASWDFSSQYMEK